MSFRVLISWSLIFASAYLAFKAFVYLTDGFISAANTTTEFLERTYNDYKNGN